MRILHTADVHLNDTIGERWQALVTVVAQAETQSADVLVIAGDLFDHDIDARRLKAELRGVFDEYAGRVLIIPGNHDTDGIRPGDYYGERVTIMTSDDAVDIENCRFLGLPFEPVGVDGTLERIQAAAIKLDDQRINFLLYHGELLNLVPGAGAFGDESGDHDYMPVRLSAFDNTGFDYVLAGHFHRGYGVHRYEGGYFIYPGSPVSISRKETGVRHANLIVLGDVNGKAPQPVALDTHHVSRVDVVLDPFSDVHPLDQLDDRLKNLHDMAVADVRIRGFVDLSATEYTEMEFAGALQQTLSRYPVKFGETDGWQDVGEVLSNDLFRRFNARIPQQAGEESDASERMRRMVIESLMETMHAR